MDSEDCKNTLTFQEELPSHTLNPGMCVYFMGTDLNEAKYRINIIINRQVGGVLFGEFFNSKVFRFKFHDRVCNIRKAATSLPSVGQHVIRFQLLKAILNSTM